MKTATIVLAIAMTGTAFISPSSSQTPAPADAVASVQKTPRKKMVPKAPARLKKIQAGKNEQPKALPLWMTADPDRVTSPTNESAPPQNQPKSVVSHRKPVDRIEFGGKWSGANDTSEKTRVQNYNGDATGTGGEVGMKLHF